MLSIIFSAGIFIPTVINIITQKDYVLNMDSCIALVAIIIFSSINVFLITLKKYKIKFLLNHGIKITATINRITIYRSKRTLSFRYTYHNKNYYSKNIVNLTKDTAKITRNENVVVFVNPDKLTEAFIAELFVRFLEERYT
jgi:hypothetical protein